MKNHQYEPEVICYNSIEYQQNWKKDLLRHFSEMFQKEHTGKST